MYYILEDGQAFFSFHSGILSNRAGEQIVLRVAESLLLNCLLNGIIDKRTLIETIWPTVIVTDSSYHRLIFELRKQFSELGLNAENIKTIPRRGCGYAGNFETFTQEHEARARFDTFYSTPDTPPVLEIAQAPDTDILSTENIKIIAPEITTASPPTAQRKKQYFPLLRISLIVLQLSLLGGSLGLLTAWFLAAHAVSITAQANSPTRLVNTSRLSLNETIPGHVSVYYTENKWTESYYICKKMPITGELEDCTNYTYYF